ncbi:MAG TPA: hypothetical protein VFZ71_03365, partial [Pyrinomonadaceae bacterium]
PTFEDKAVLEFFETSGRNLLAAAEIAGVCGIPAEPQHGFGSAGASPSRLSPSLVACEMRSTCGNS